MPDILKVRNRLKLIVYKNEYFFIEQIRGENTNLFAKEIS